MYRVDEKSPYTVSRCWQWHTKLWWSFPCRLHWGAFNGSGNRRTCFQARCFSPTPRPVFNTSKSERPFFPIQQCRSSWWSLIKPFPERSHHLGHGLSRVLSLIHPHTCHQALLERVTACVSHTENRSKFCGCGKSRMHYLGHCCQPTILHCTACCAVMCKLKLSLRCILSGCTVTFRPPCSWCVPI
jgi:hypothetical protein